MNMYNDTCSQGPQSRTVCVPIGSISWEAMRLHHLRHGSRQRLEHEKHCNCYCICVTSHVVLELWPRETTSRSRGREDIRVSSAPFVDSLNGAARRCPTAASALSLHSGRVATTEPLVASVGVFAPHRPCPPVCKSLVLDACGAVYELVVAAGPLAAPVAPDGADVAAVWGCAAAPDGGSPPFGALLCA